MSKLLDTPIEIIVRFTKNKPIPLKFKWKNNNINIKNINFIHKSKKGTAQLIHFSVSNETSSYQITFNLKNLTWTLDDVYS